MIILTISSAFLIEFQLQIDFHGKGKYFLFINPFSLTYNQMCHQFLLILSFLWKFLEILETL